MVLARAALPAGVVLWALAADPGGDYLYASSAHVVAGDAYEGAVLFQYSASSPRSGGAARKYR